MSASIRKARESLEEVNSNSIFNNPERYVGDHMHIERSNKTEYLGKFVGVTERQNNPGVSYIFKIANEFVIEFVPYRGDVPVFKVSDKSPKDKSKSPSTPRSKDKSKSPPNKTKSRRSFLPPIVRGNWT